MASIEDLDLDTPEEEFLETHFGVSADEPENPPAPQAPRDREPENPPAPQAPPDHEPENLLSPQAATDQKYDLPQDGGSGPSRDQPEEHGEPDCVPVVFDNKTIRLIEMNVSVLSRFLKHIHARRDTSVVHETGRNERRNSRLKVLDEVEEIIYLPSADGRGRAVLDPVELNDDVLDGLRDYISAIASTYENSNPFHNFEHATHAAMAVTKFLSKAVAPDTGKQRNRDKVSNACNYAFCITTDPLTQFACVFSALIHDVGHKGVTNAQLMKEDFKLASYYNYKSLAEQNSVDLAWDLLMDGRYDNLRRAIYQNDDEKKRFRQIIVNSVLATDILDGGQRAKRNVRWERSFLNGSQQAESTVKEESRKATVLIEHLVQASDVAYAMQHWDIYIKWNTRMFEERYSAYLSKREDNDPSETWGRTETGFFDFHVVPLARKLKECGLFDDSINDCLNNAMNNRREWSERGHELVVEMVATVKGSLDKNNADKNATTGEQDVDLVFESITATLL